MTDTTNPAASTGTAARFALPYLFPGQAQKELTVNEGLARIDLLLHPAIEGVAAVPPEDAADGGVWLVGPDAADEWGGRADQLAGRQGGTWLYIKPVPGMSVYDKATGGSLFFDGVWRDIAAPPVPAVGDGGDSELRTAFAALVETLGKAGILSNN